MRGLKMIVAAMIVYASASCVAQVSGSGDTDRIPKFSGSSPSSTLANSAISESNGVVVIGVGSPLIDFSVSVLGGSGNGAMVSASNGSWGKILAGAGQWSFNPLVKAGDTAFIFAASGGMDSGGYFLGPWSGSANGLRMTNTGSIGVGTGDPAEKLDVVGNIKLSGGGSHLILADGSIQSTAWNGTTCGGDYAESVDVAGDRRAYAPGDLLVIDAAAPDHFARSSEPYSTLIAGVFSTKPGLTGRRQGAPVLTGDEVPMAMMGIVPTKVSAENGPIKPGDLLVSSATPGFAMKGTDRSRLTGAVVGKAMGRLNEGTGVIEVLVSLQ